MFDTPPTTGDAGNVPASSLLLDELRNFRDRRRVMARNYEQIRRGGLMSAKFHHRMTTAYRALLTFEATQRHIHRLPPPEVDEVFAEIAREGGWLAPKLG